MPSASSRRIAAFAATITVGGLLVSMPDAAQAVPGVVTQTYGYSVSTQTFTVPAGITQLTLALAGGEGGQGGTDAAGPSVVGGYQGVVSGTIAVTPGQTLTIAVGQGGTSGAGGAGSSDPAHYTDGTTPGGVNPLGAYSGGNGGVAGFQGSSGYGAGGGAATVVTIGGTTIVAGGAGGAGGSGQYPATQGRAPASSFVPRADAVSSNGQQGITVATVCNNAASPGCDGGGGGAGGGGVVGGAQGDVQFGSGTSNEWYGYGGYPGQNSTGGIGGLSADYQYYPDDAANGSVVVSYTTGAPGAPTAVSGVAGDTSVALSWTPPTSVGESAISDYVVQYAMASTPTTWITFTDGVSTAPSTTVTGLADGTAYVFQVMAVNTAGSGAASVASSSVTPMGVPSSPTITSVTAQDGALSLAFTAPSSGSAPTGYEYQVNSSGVWLTASASTSPLQISGLTNGTLYTVQIRADSVVGEGAASLSSSGTPEALPGAPSISSTSTGIGTATVSFTPGYSGGGSIIDYQYELNNSGTWTSGATVTSPLTITSLANATTYLIAIRAVTASGGGAASANASVTTPGTPAAPVLGSIVAGDTTLSIPFTAGATGGSTITSYQYELTPGAWTTALSLASPIVVTGLTNGTTYQVSVRAINAVGNGAAATPQAATPATVPGAPAIVGNTVAGSNLQLSAAFTAPTSDGGSTILSYDYSTDGGATWLSAGTTTSPIIITVLSVDGTTPLINGNQYLVELRAVNTVGAGTASAVATGIAQTVPSAPTIASVTPGPSSLSVVITPASNGGAAITSYQYQLGSSGWFDTGTLGTSFLIAGLTNGTSYGVTVRAVNVPGNGAASGSVAGTPRTTPGQPTIPSVTRGNQLLTIAVADTNNGGSAITSWQYSTDGGTTWFTAVATTSPLVITALSTNGSTAIANGTSYPVAVRAVNAAGASAPSATTGVGPSTTPVAPTVVLVAQNQAVQVAFTVSDNGGSPVSAIEYQLNSGSWTDAGTLSSPFVISSLTNGTTYVVNVRADNAIGLGSASISASATPLTVPDPPTSVSAVSDTASADVSWTAPSDTGGSAITTYVAGAFLTPGSPTPFATCTTATTACSIVGLTNAVTYYVSVIAQNIAGASIASTPVVAVTPLARPGAPTLNTLTPGDSFLSLAFTAGTAGSSSITAYQYQLNGGSWVQASSTSTPLTITGVTNGTSYTVALRAVSNAGVGVASTTLTATPFGFPDAPDPATTIANGVGGAVAVSWLAPNSNGSPITSYTATAFNAPTAGSQVTTCTTATLSCTLSGLSNGTTYYVSLQAQNTAGLSVRSARIAVAPSLLPSAVSAVTGVAGNGQVALSWTPGSTGATAINDYAVWYASTGSYALFSDGVSTSTSTTVTGLTNGTAYTFEIVAINTGGNGPFSAASAAVTPATVPDAPTIGVATAGNATVTLLWTPPVNNGGSAVTGYVITPSSGPMVTVGNVIAYTLTGLTNGITYTFQVAAITNAGTGAQSSASNSVTPSPTAPAVPTVVIAVGGNTSATVSWTPPIDNGGTAVTGYVITPSTGAPVTVGNVTTYTITGLTNGAPYTFTIAAINIAGTGGNSATSNSVTPSPTTPGAPTAVTATAGNTAATVNWVAPADNGGLAIIGYVITPSIGSPVTVGNVTTYTMTGLVNGTGYTFTVAAINTLGTGSTSVAASNTVTPAASGGGGATTPSAPVQIFGADRFATAVATSAVEFPTADSAGGVVLARADDYPDALVGIRLAAAKNAPLLFTDGGALGLATQAEIGRVLPVGGTVYLLGGTAAIPTTVDSTLTALGYVVVRYAGTDRFGTALAVAAALGNPGTVLLATGINFPDALAAGPAAAHVNGVVLLTDGSVLPAAVQAYLSAHPGIVYAVGGPAVAADPSAIALTGADRYATAAAVARLFFRPTTLGVASGTSFADALSGGAFLAHDDGPLLLSAPAALPASTTTYLGTAKTTVLTSTLFGGPMALSSAVATAVGVALGSTP